VVLPSRGTCSTDQELPPDHQTGFVGHSSSLCPSRGVLCHGQYARSFPASQSTGSYSKRVDNALWWWSKCVALYHTAFPHSTLHSLPDRDAHRCDTALLLYPRSEASGQTDVLSYMPIYRSHRCFVIHSYVYQSMAYEVRGSHHDVSKVMKEVTHTRTHRSLMW
jgi:hypothetical protein